MRVFGGKSKQMFCNYTANVKPQGQNQIEGTYIECRDTNSLSKKGTANISCNDDTMRRHLNIELKFN